MNEPGIFTRIHELSPPDTRLVASRWHRDRIALGGFIVEARVFLKSLTVSRNKNRRFLIIGRARSGTTLLTSLLNSHTEIHCDAEVLHRNVISPLTHLDRLAGKSAAPIYGAKLLSYQMVLVHNMRDPRRFLKHLIDEGFSLFHLERETFFQTLSLTVAQHRKQYHSDRGATVLRDKLWFDPQDFAKRLRWNEALLEYERTALADLEHMRISYEQDLCDPHAQSETLRKICTVLGCSFEDMATPLKKVLPADPESILANYADIRRAAELDGCGHLLPALGRS